MNIKIGVVANKGGVGKTTISHLLSLGFSRLEYDVALCVTDPTRETELYSNSTRPFAIMDARSKTSFTETIEFINDSAEELGNVIAIIDGAGNRNDYYKAVVSNTDVVILPVGSGFADISTVAKDIKELRELGAKRVRLVKSRWSSKDLVNQDKIKLLSEALGDDISLLINYVVKQTEEKPLERITLPHLDFQYLNIKDEEQAEAAATLASAETYHIGYITSHITSIADNLTESLLMSIMFPSKA